MNPSTTRTISIHEVESPTVASALRSIHVNIDIDRNRLHTDKVIRDPFEEEVKYEDYRWYVEEYGFPKQRATQADLNDEFLNHEYHCERARSVCETLVNYRKALLETLDLPQEDFHSAQRLHIDIWVSTNHEEACFNINRILWEILEWPPLWSSTLFPTNPRIQVMVKRIVTTSPCAGLPWEERLITRSSPLRVLLVIARNLEKDLHYDYTDVQAHIAQIHLLEVQENLRPLIHSHHIELEILRPGSFKALKNRLENDDGCFDLIHFDLHGIVTGTPKNAYLLFAKDEIEEEGLEKIIATDVAELLRKHGIRCVVTNACQTADASDRYKANLSQVFIQKGIALVSAMSHKISTSAIDIFYSKFYWAFIADGLNFPEATSLGRELLRSTIEGGEYEEQRFQHWCVPVTYVCPNKHLLKGLQQPHRRWLLQTLTRKVISYFRKHIVNTIVRSLALLGLIQLYDLLQNQLLSQFFQQIATLVSTSSNFVPPSLHQGKQMPNLPMLDIGILDLERQLINYRVVYLHGPFGHDNNSLLEKLAQLWCSTHFVEQVILIHASTFIGNKRAAIIINRRDPCRYIEVQNLHINACIPPQNREIAIIIEDIDELYPESVERLSEEELVLLEQGQEELNGFLNTTFGRPENFKDTRIYLIMSGEHEGSWWEELEGLEIAGNGIPFFRQDSLPCRPRMPTTFV